MFDTEYIGGKQPNLNKDWLRTTLTQLVKEVEAEAITNTGKETKENLMKELFKVTLFDQNMSDELRIAFLKAFVQINFPEYRKHITSVTGVE